MPPTTSLTATRTAVLQISGDEAPPPFSDWSSIVPWAAKRSPGILEHLAQVLANFGTRFAKDHIRPNERSNFWERWSYFRKARRICRLAARDVITSGRYAPGEVFQIALIDGCFKRRPPQPHVTLSEVIAVLFDPVAVQRWRLRGELADKLEFVAGIVRRRSRDEWKRTGFRTYVLSYIAGSDEARSDQETRNQILSISLDEYTKPNDSAGEARERETLLTDLKARFGDDLIHRALAMTQNAVPRVAMDQELVHLAPLETAEKRIMRPDAIVTVVGGIALFVTLAGSFFGLIWLVAADGPADGDLQALIGLVGMVSAYGLMILGDVADQILRRSKI